MKRKKSKKSKKNGKDQNEQKEKIGVVWSHYNHNRRSLWCIVLKTISSFSLVVEKWGMGVCFGMMCDCRVEGGCFLVNHFNGWGVNKRMIEKSKREICILLCNNALFQTKHYYYYYYYYY